MLLICVSIYLKSVLRYKFVIMDNYNAGILCLRERGYENPWLFFDTKGAREQKGLGNTNLDSITRVVE